MMGSSMMEYAGGSLPEQMESWGELKGAYRFLSNPRIEPEQIGAGHRALTFLRCQEHPVVLCVQDDTELRGARIGGKKDKGDGGRKGEVLHSTLAVLPDGELLGILDQQWFQHVKPKKGETRLERFSRWRESEVWSDAVAGVDSLGELSVTCRLIHVADRGSDNLGFMHKCLSSQRGFVIRAKHDRCVEEGKGGGAKLWEHMISQASAGIFEVQIGCQRDSSGKITRQERKAILTVRFACVELESPQNHCEKYDSLKVNVVYLREEHPPEGVEGVDWMLLTSEEVKDFTAACRIAAYYQRRWLIEEWHRGLKEGCRLEHSQVHEVDTLRRLSAMLSVVAVRLLQVRNLAQGRCKDAPQALRKTVDLVWIQVVSLLAGVEAEQLTPELFWKTVAKKGGFIGRKSDGRPGWKVIWRGWQNISPMVQLAELMQQKSMEKNCG